MIDENTSIALLEKEYKDHTIQNAVNSIDEKDLPIDARIIHQQAIRRISVTLQVIDSKTNNVVETITGKTESGSVKVASRTLSRRSLDLTMQIDQDLFPRKHSLIWFDKYIRVYVGIDDNSKNGRTMNFLVGTYWVDNVSITIGNDNKMSVTLNDKMTKHDYKKIENPIKIKPKTPIDEAIRLVMESTGETEFGRFDTPEDYEVVPYTLDYKVGESYVDIIQALRDMYMDYDCGYDLMGRFEFVKLKVQKSDEIEEPKWRFDDNMDNGMDMKLSFAESYNLKDIINDITVFGATSEKTGLTPMGNVRITDPKSPFNVYAIDKRKDILVESKYVTNEQCISKAKYEVSRRSNFNETCTIETPPIYILDTNDIIDVVHPITQETIKYQIDSMNYGLTVDSVMSIQAHKMYFVSLDYGEEKLPIVDDIINGINNYGWISLGEERIRDCYNIMGDGKATIIVRFQDNELGGEQASIISYPTTPNQTMLIDIADFDKIKGEDPNGDGGTGSKGDYLDRVIPHEMFHAVTNNFFGHEMMMELPLWFKEGFAEFIHGAKERFTLCYEEKNRENKKKALISLAEKQLNNEWESKSEDYVAAYLIAAAIYELCSPSDWKNLFIRLKGKPNPSINFVSKLLPIAETNEKVISMILDKMENMDRVWNALFNEDDPDTCSVGGIHFMNLYNMPLTSENVFNNANATDQSIGFSLRFER